MGKDSKISWTDNDPKANRITRRDGYIFIRCPSYPYAGKNGYVLEHRLVMARALGRPITPDEHVHHINGIRADNRPENLKLMTNSEHMTFHMSLLTKEQRAQQARYWVEYSKKHAKPRTLIACACGCGQMLETPDSKARSRSYIAGHSARGKTWRWNRG